MQNPATIISQVENQFFHSLKYDERSFSYKEATVPENFYQNNFYSASVTADSLLERKLENRIGWSTLPSTHTEGKKRMLNISVAACHQVMYYWQNTIDTLLRTAYLQGDIFSSDESLLQWGLSTKYNVHGTNRSDYSIKGVLKYYLGSGRNHFTQLTGMTENQSPSFIFNRFASNHFVWNNNFERQNLTNVKFGLHSIRYNFVAEANHSIVQNYLYFLSGGPVQFNKPINISSASLYKSFKLYKFVLSSKVIYQRSEQVVRLPELISLNSFYYEGRLFKRALLSQIGCDFRYYTAYKGDAYMPATGQFYIQNGLKVGNIPYLDAFVNFKVKTARFFVKMENILAPDFGYSSNMVPFYPVPGRAFKFGISWQFFD